MVFPLKKYKKDPKNDKKRASKIKKNPLKIYHSKAPKIRKKDPNVSCLSDFLMIMVH
jgi:hypothetical protein